MHAALIAIAATLVVACGSSATPAPAPGQPTYLGRPIAAPCSHLGADWLDRPDREAREQPERVLDLLGVAPGMAVADVGAGTGYFTVRLARRVGPKGQVLATDIQAEMLRRIDARLSRDDIHNVTLIRAGEHAANLPARCCDLVLMVDVYHELSDPPGVMAGVRRALRPYGRLALVEYRGEDKDLPIKPEHKMTLARIREELQPMGFAYITSIEELPDQRIVIFRRDDAPR